MAIIPAQARGLPALLAAEYQTSEYFSSYVLAASPTKEPRKLKGAKIGVSSLGATSYMMGQLMLKAPGIAKEAKFVAVGRVSQSMAALKAKVVNATITSIPAYVNVIVKG